MQINENRPHSDPGIASSGPISNAAVEADLASQSTLRELPVLGFALTIIVLIVGGVFGYLSTGRLGHHSERVVHTHEVICALEALLSTVKDAETGQRGYLLTVEPSHLKTHDDAAERIPTAIAEIKTLVTDNPSQLEHVSQLQKLITSKLNELKLTIDLTKNGEQTQSLQIVREGTGKAMMDEARVLVERMKQTELDLLAKRNAEARTSYQTSIFVILFTVLTGVSLVGLVFYLAAHHDRRQKQAANLLADQREWYRVTLNSIGDGVLTTDSQGKVTFLNPLAEELTGWRLDDAKGEHFERVFHIVNEYTREPVSNPITKVIEHGSIVGLANHTILISKNGEERPIDDSAAPIVNSAKKLVGVVLVFRDVRERRGQERELEEARSRLESTLSAGEIGTWEYDAVRNQVRTDKNLASMIGIASADSPSKKLEEFLSFIHPQDRARVQEDIQRTLTSGDGFEAEYRLIQADGQMRSVIARGRVEQDEAGKAVRLPGVVVDISRQRDAELALAKIHAESELQRRLYDSILSHSPDFVYTFDLDGRFTYVNKALLDLLQLTAFEAVGKNFHELNYPTELATRLQSQIRQVIETRAPIKDETPFTSHEGVGYYEYIFVPIFGASDSVELVAGTTRDITSQKRIQAELRDVAAKLSEADRRKDEFLATLAHELRNPLAPISAGLEVMKRVKDDPEAMETIRGTMERQSQQMVRLIDDLLDVSRITQGKLELRHCDVTLADILNSAVEATQPFIHEAHHQLTVAIPSEGILLYADPNRLAQVFSNLLNNSTKYTPEGGRIELTAELAEDEVIVSVKDNGMGIPLELQGKIFEMFAQIDRPMEKGYRGLGIGLTLVKRLVEMHQGRIEVLSDGQGKGTEFKVHLPILKSQGSTQTLLPQEKTENAAPLRVLVVDDNNDAATMLALVVKILGNEVRKAADGVEAIRVAEEFKPELILMDIGMPQMNGYEAARHIRLQPWGKEMTLVALTGWGQEEDRRKAKEAGFDHHLVKPAEPNELQRLLNKVKGEKQN